MKCFLHTVYSFIIFLCCFSQASYAIKLRIIHVNDLHSHFERARTEHEGSYARVKGMIDSIKRTATQNHEEVLALNAGDFMEGAQFYFANQGRNSLEAMNLFDFDAITIGNHDWMMGNKKLDELLSDIPLNFKFLGANFQVKDTRPYLKNILQPYTVFNKNGVRVAILGLTTSSIIYQYNSDGVSPPINTAIHYKNTLKEKSDFVIALTHLGVAKDKQLADRTSFIDMIVGGHSHTLLNTPILRKNIVGRKIPIVQAGDHGRYVGDALLELTPGKPLQLLSYEMHAVTDETAPADPEVQNFVAQSRQALEDNFSPSWLYEPIAYSDVRASYASNPEQPWNKVIADSFFDATDADVVLNPQEFIDPSDTLGVITREKIFAFYPRMYSTTKKLGWTIWTGEIPGWAIALLMTSNSLGGPMLSTNKNKPVYSDTGLYKIAFAEAFGRAAPQLNFLKSIALRHRRDTGIPIWTALEKRLKKISVVK